MANEEKTSIEIDFWDIVKKALSLWWIWVLTAIGGGTAGFLYTHFNNPLTYKASTMLYVNNKSGISDTISKLTSADILASQSLVDVYCIMIDTRTCLNKVDDHIRDIAIENGDEPYVSWKNEDGKVEILSIKDSIQRWHKDWSINSSESKFAYNYDYIHNKMKVEAKDETEIFTISITSTSPFESILISNAVADVCKTHIEDIIDGTSVKIVDYASVTTAISRNRGRNGIIGGIIGGVVGLAIVVGLYFLQDDINDSKWLANVYDEFPVLATIPDANDNGHGKYTKYSNYGYGYGYYGSHVKKNSSSKATEEKEVK